MCVCVCGCVPVWGSSMFVATSKHSFACRYKSLLTVNMLIGINRCCVVKLIYNNTVFSMHRIAMDYCGGAGQYGDGTG